VGRFTHWRFTSWKGLAGKNSVVFRWAFRCSSPEATIRFIWEIVTYSPIPLAPRWERVQKATGTRGSWQRGGRTGKGKGNTGGWGWRSKGKASGAQAGGPQHGRSTGGCLRGKNRVDHHRAKAFFRKTFGAGSNFGRTGPRGTPQGRTGFHWSRCLARGTNRRGLTVKTQKFQKASPGIRVM